MSYKDDLVTKIATSNSCELVAIQYQAIIEKTDDLKKCITDEDIEKADYITDSIRDIISNLISTLGLENDDFRKNTIELYLYINKIINEAKIKKDISKLSIVIDICTTLRNAWYSAGKNIGNVNENISNAITYGKNDINISGSSKDFGSV